MKKLFAIAVLGLVLVSCKKSSNGSSNYIQATVNGKNVTYNVLGQGILSNAGKNLSIGAISGTADTSAYSLNIRVSSVVALINGAYSDTANYLNNPAVYNHVNASLNPTLDTAVSFINYTNANLGSNPFIVNITSISTTAVQGTFQGTLYLSGDSSNTTTKQVFTNGKFNLSLILR